MRVALPKGRLLAETLGLLDGCGLTFTFSGDRDYSPVSSEPRVSAKVVKVRSVPQLVGLGNFQAGFCGLDLVTEAGHDEVRPLVNLGLNAVRLVVAVPQATPDLLQSPPKRPLVIATEYEQIAARWAMKRGLAHIIVQTWGSTEGYAPDDADIVFDNTETGATLRANGLVVIDEIMTSSTWLIANTQAADDPDVRWLAELVDRETGRRS